MSTSTPSKRSGAVALVVIAALVVAGLAGLSLAVPQVRAAGTISLTTFGTAYTQDFNTLASSGTSSTVPTGWDFAETGTNANTTYTAGTGLANAGDTYSFGAAANTERAFGGLQSGSLNPTIGASFTNNTGGVITSLAVSYTGEEWRLGTVGRSDRIDFQYSANAASLTTGTWTDFDALDFATPDTSGTAGARDGNSAPYRTALSATITGLNVPNGASFWIRWTDFNASGADDGLAVDDFSLTPDGTPPPPGLSINDVSAVEGNAGTNAFNFTVNLGSPAGAGGVTFDIATQDNTATVADNDYVANLLTGQIIPAGSSSYTFSVLVNGDTTTEPDEIFFVNATNVVGANVLDGQGQGTIVNDDVCGLPYTPISQIQGSGAVTPLSGQTVTTQGVVVGDYEGPSPALRGFFVHDPVGDANPATSDGIFVFEGSNANTVNLGDIVRVTGTAGENQGQSQISVGTIVNCGTGSVTPTAVTFPVASPDFLEQYEGMLVRLPQTMVVTEHFQLGRFGQVVLSAAERLKQPTNVVAPGAPALALQAQNNLNKIILDDASQTQNPDPILFGRGGLPLSASNTLRGGDTATGIVGIMTYTWAGNAASGNAYRIRPINALGGGVPNFQPANLRPTTVPAVGGTLKVAGMNLLNFFNTFDGASSNPPWACTLGVGGPLTDCRGADDLGEFGRQWPKTVEAMVGTNADVIGVIEMENDGYGPDSAIQFLVNKLNDDTAPGIYAFIDVDSATGQVNALGTDAIKVGLIYKPASVTPVGTTAALNTVAFVNGGDASFRNRPALAQAFQQNSSGARFIVSVNHLKSKGSACDAPDAGDGQGNCNIVRTNAANQLVTWLASDPTGTGDPDALITGDLNAYAMEDPITAIKNAGYTNLIYTFGGGDEAYSYVFDGQWGYLDHALASASLVTQVAGVVEWHINADEPSVLDYNDDFKSAGQLISLYSPDQFRIADHDPVLTGLNLLNEPPVVTAGGPYSGDEGASIDISGSATDPENHLITYAWSYSPVSGVDPGATCAFGDASAAATTVTCTDDGTFTLTLTATDAFGASASAEATLTVANVSPTVTVDSPANGSLYQVNAPVSVSASFSDPGANDTHTCQIDWGNGTTTAGMIAAGTCSGSYAYPAAGIYTIVVTVADDDGGSNSASTSVVVFDPNGGFVTGGGWIDSPAGAYWPNPTVTGKANLGFVAKYKKGASIPEGNVNFRLNAVRFGFNSTSYQWLVVPPTGVMAQIKGYGTINGGGTYGFMIWAGDSAPDTFRIKIWNGDNENDVIYDNGANQPLGGGSIEIHQR